jgi:hypothetical protein
MGLFGLSGLGIGIAIWCAVSGSVDQRWKVLPRSEEPRPDASNARSQRPATRAIGVLAHAASQLDTAAEQSRAEPEPTGQAHPSREWRLSHLRGGSRENWRELTPRGATHAVIIEFTHTPATPCVVQERLHIAMSLGRVRHLHLRRGLRVSAYRRWRAAIDR